MARVEPDHPDQGNYISQVQLVIDVLPLTNIRDTGISRLSYELWLSPKQVNEIVLG
jgi:hypothetical protein